MKPKANTEQCELLAFLLDDGQWHKGRTLRMNGRMIRAACAEQPRRFLSGQSGYKLVAFARLPEIDAAIADLRSRIARLNDRANELALARYNRVVDFQMVKQGSLW